MAAREDALELAGAFTNDGYKIRDGHWSRPAEAARAADRHGQPVRGQPVLFFARLDGQGEKGQGDRCTTRAGNQVGDEQFFQEKSRAAAGVSPVASGLYYVSVELLEGEQADFCLLYSYK